MPRLHGRTGWLYLGDSEPVAVTEWVIDVPGRIFLRTTPLVSVPAPARFRLYPTSQAAAVPPDAASQHFWGVVQPGGMLASVARHPTVPDPEVA